MPFGETELCLSHILGETELCLPQMAFGETQLCLPQNPVHIKVCARASRPFLFRRRL
jgi:hypothetical protein